MRDLRVDNAKGILIFLVVLGHFIEAVKGWEATGLRGLWTAIYLFHMPAFIFLAGMTAKSDNLLRRVLNMAVLLVFFHLALVIPLTAMAGGKSPVGLFQPYWMMWFLLSMIWWMLFLPVINRLPYPLVISTALAVGAGLVPSIDYGFSLSRTLVYLPFFVAGNLYGWRLLAWLKQLSSLFGLAGMVLFLSVAAFFLMQADLAGNWFRGSQGYAALGSGEADGLLIRSGLLGLASMALILFLLALPANQSWLTKLGSASLAVFLLHGFVVKPFGVLVGSKLADYSTGSLLVLLLGLSAVTVAVLGLPVWDRLIRQQASRVVDKVLGLMGKLR